MSPQGDIIKEFQHPKNDMIILTDEQIQELISEEKPLPDGLVPSPKMTTRNQSLRRDIEVSSDAGHEFIINSGRMNCTFSIFPSFWDIGFRA